MSEGTVRVDGKLVEGQRLSFNPLQEGWNEYQLEDRTVIRIRHVVKTVVKLHKPDPVTGGPQYLATGGLVIDFEAPEELYPPAPPGPDISPPDGVEA